jgi:hypothetical protein
MTDEDLKEWYSALAPQFKAGLGFQNVEFWEEIADGNVEVLRWVKGGYSEYVADVIPKSKHKNNKNTGGENAEFVQRSIAELVVVGAVRGVQPAALWRTHLIWPDLHHN